jgi:hypothetical protein
MREDANVLARLVFGLVVPTAMLALMASGCDLSTDSSSGSSTSASGTSTVQRAAARQPTFSEREAITAAMPAWLRRYPVGCIWLEISVSKDGRFAEAGPGFLNASRPPCSKYVSNGTWFLKKQTKWSVVFNGSDPPPCSLKVPSELTEECL